MESIKNFFEDYRTDIIRTGILIVVTVLILSVTSFFVTEFENQAVAANEALVAIQQEIANTQHNDASYIGKPELVKSEDSSVEYVGNMVDGARWNSDIDFFWDYISPAFNFNSVSEYNSNREKFINGRDGYAGLGEHPFVTEFMTYHDIVQSIIEGSNGRIFEPSPADISEAEHAFNSRVDKSSLIVRPVKENSNGDYSYVAFVRAGSKYNGTVMFTFTVSHSTGKDGAPKLSLEDFEYFTQGGGNATFDNLIG